MNLAMPVFLDIGKHAAKGPHHYSPRLVAAIRWDYEYGLMRPADIARKYAGRVTPDAVRGICTGRTYKEIKARRGA